MSLLQLLTEDDLSVINKDNNEYTDYDSLINLPAFKKWFGNSKTVDKSGKPVLFFHGSFY